MNDENKFAAWFYRSWEWQRCRAGYIKSVGGLCERCAAKGLVTAGTQVHHRIRLTPSNLRDPSVALCWDNLELLCDECHQAEHHNIRWRCDAGGHVEI